MLFRFYAFLVVVAVLCPWVSQGAELPGRVVVKVTVQGTGTPVAGAKVHLNRGEMPGEGGNQAEPVTDENGRCELPVHWGNVRLLGPLPPRGFWTVPKSRDLNQLEQFVVTREQPKVERTFEVSPGVAWPMKLVTAQGRPVPGVRLTAGRSDRSRGGTVVTDAQGKADLTLPLDGGKLSLGFYQAELSTYPHGHVSLEIAPNFDPTAVVSQKRSASGHWTELVDRQGRTASWEGCTVVLEDGAARIVFVADDPPGPSLAGGIAGTVVDEQGQAIRDATVVCIAHGLPYGVTDSKTDERGAFRVHGFLKWARPGEKPSFGLTVTKKGFAAIEAGHFFQANSDGLHELEQPLVLAAGHSVRLRVLNKAGQPVEGAWVERMGRAYQVAKSDAGGFCTLGNLPVGSCGLRASYGDDGATCKVVVSPASASAAAVDIRLAKTDHPLNLRRAAVAPKPLTVGEPAPEWSIREWTDGQARTLAALRGRVVVIDFWDFGCTPCRQITLPVTQRLRPKFADKDVTFISIHPAGTEMRLVKELLAVERWDFVVGFDQGESATASETNQGYGVSGYPTEVIVDRQGRIAFHSGNQERTTATMKAAAEEIGLSWPLEQDASREEVRQRLQRLHEHWMTKEIEKALAKE